jgi:hypothetical protein
MRFLAARTTAPRPGTLRDLYGDLAPVAVVPAAGGDVTVCPGRDAVVEAGDEVTLIGTPRELHAATAVNFPERTLLTPRRPAASGVAAVRHLRGYVVSLLRAADRRLAVALGALVAVLAASTGVLRLAYAAGDQHISVLDALYFTVETITTVGFGDFTFRWQPPWLIAFAIGLMLAGALFVAVFFALLTNVIVSRRIEESLGRQQITGLSGHILVIGRGCSRSAAPPTPRCSSTRPGARHASARPTRRT